ncbi:hypothetical protein H0R94_06240 [Treponema socranskii]|uniref:hypothetical protein n=1 Tax=Treponema socranskii TaxID=53419 RepID=UPI003D9462AC
MKIKKLSIVLFLAAVFFSAAYTQVSVDPADEFYEAALRWHIRGVVSELPQLKPYPQESIRRILLAVMERGDREEASDAREYYDRIFGKTWHISAEAKGATLISRNGTANERDIDGRLFFSLHGGGDVLFANGFGTGYRAGVSAKFLDTSSGVFKDAWASPAYDTLVDTIERGTAAIEFDADAIASYANEKISLSAGYNRTGYTNYIDGGNVLSPAAFNAPQFSFAYDGRRLDFVQHFAALRASDMLGKNGPYGKFLSFHALRFTPNRKIHLSYYDSVVYGKRFDPSYLIPLPAGLIASANGYDDNVIAGLLFEYNFFSGVSWLTDLSINKLDIPQMARLRFNADNRLAFKTGLSYTPNDSPCKLLTFSYTIISPYTYTSEETNGESYNYHSYTNWGRSIGQSLPPNSDHISLKIKLEPVKRFTVSTFASITRHANVYQSYSGDELREMLSEGKRSTDGSINSQRYASTQFLSESYVMYIARGGLEASYRFPRVKAGVFELNGIFAYTYISNAGMDTPMFSGATGATTDAQFDLMRTAWGNQLHDEYDIFFSLGVKWTY